MEMVSTPEEWPAFATHMDEFGDVRNFFFNFSIKHISRENNTMTDNLARGFNSYLSVMLYVDLLPPIWLSESANMST